MGTKIQDKINIKNYSLVIENAIEEFRSNSFIEVWQKSISEILEEEDIRINSLVIGMIGELPERIYVGANTNRVLVFDLNGLYIDNIELDEGVEVEKLIILDVTNHSGNELIVQVGDDSILFYNHNHKGDYEELPYKIHYATSSITALFGIKPTEEYTPLFIGDSNGDVLKNTYQNLKLSKNAQNIIPDTEKLAGETVTAITGSVKLLNNNFGLIIGYKNGLLLLLNSDFKIVSKFDIDREIENIYLIEKTQSIVINTDDNNVYHFSVKDLELVNDWIYHFNNTISTILPDSQEDSEIEFFVLSEDNGTISCFDESGKFILTGDPSFEGTSGVYYRQKLILASREGEISQFEIIEQNKSRDLQKLIHDSYAYLLRSKQGNNFYEFFNSEFDSEDNVDYFKFFLTSYLDNNPDKQVVENIIGLFARKKYNTDTAEGLIRKLMSSSQLKNIFLDKFKETAVSEAFAHFHKRIQEKRSSTNLIERAKIFFKKDIIKYIELMCELRIRKLDKIWVNNILDDDHVVGIKYYHDNIHINNFQLLIATEKGTVLLLNRQTGQIIWRFKLEAEDGTITNIDVADICNDGFLEIILGLENSQNSIVILSTDKDKFNSANNEVQLEWFTGNAKNNSFKLYLTRCTVAGMDYEAVHKVKCFDFDYNGVQDLIISSENEKFDVFYFDNFNRARIFPKTKSIDLNEDDILVFELVRDENQQIILYSGSASGNINKHIYDGNGFISSGKSFTERDAKITDILHAEIENEKVVLFSSEDNFIYCLNSDLEYKWAFKTGGDVKSIGISKFNNQEFIFTISDDGYIYAIDASGNKKWRYLFMAKDGSASPLDMFLVKNDEITVADSDGNIHLLHLKDTIDIIKKMDDDLAEAKIDIPALLNNPGGYVRIFAVRKLFSSEPDTETKQKILFLLNDGNEPEVLVRCETIKILTRYLKEQETFSIDYSNALVETLHDFSPEVRIESVKSFLSLVEQHQSNHIDIGNNLVEIAKDEDIWVKEYLAGALNKFETNNKESLLAKWNALSSLIKLNKDEEWILNEAANSIGHFLNDISSANLLINYINELFESEFEDETYERIRNKIPSLQIAYLFDVFFQIHFGSIIMIRTASNNFFKDYSTFNEENSLKKLVDKLKSFFSIVDLTNLDDIISDRLLEGFSNSIDNSSFSFSPVINNLIEYTKENNISEKVVYLNFISDSIVALTSIKYLLNRIDKRLFELAIEGSLNTLISETSRFLREKVDIEIEIENDEIILNEIGIADVNLNIVNKGFNRIEAIEIFVKLDNQSKFEIIDNIGEIGELVRAQSKKVYFKIKPRVIDSLDINFSITYKGCSIPIILAKRIFVEELIQKEWQIISNPYTAGIPIENDEIFVGREALIQEIVTAIKKDPIFLMGHRRMGKTSLAKYIQRHYLSTGDYIPIFVSADNMVFNSMNDFLLSFSRPIANELLRNKIITKDQQKEYLGAIRSNGLIDFGGFFDDILSEIYSMGKILILIIDEYPKIHEQVSLKKIDSQFISNLRGYMQNNSKEFRMIYTGASSLKYLKSQYSSNIMGVGKSIEVSFLSEKDVIELISKPLNNQMKIEDSAFKYLMELTNGQPFLVQVILRYLVDKLNREKKGSMIFKEAIEGGVNYFLEQAPHLNYDWGGFDEEVENEVDAVEKNRFQSNNLLWTIDEEKIAKAYKQLIITAVTDNWKKSKNGLSKPEIFERIGYGLKDFHKINISIFDETLNLMSTTSDILKITNNLYLIKVGLFREWVINKMNFSFDKTLLEIEHVFNKK